MPTYEYKCAQGHQFEQIQRMSEAPLDACPTCGARAERQLSAGGGLLFKGSGFYITDYRSDSYRKAAAADGGGAGKDTAGRESTGQGAADAAPGKGTATGKSAGTSPGGKAAGGGAGAESS